MINHSTFVDRIYFVIIEILKRIKVILKIIALLLVFGGLVRLFANESIFEIFGMKDLWVDHMYFNYIYRVLAAFVIFTGLLFFSVSRNIEKNINVLKAIKWGFIIVGATMTIAGYYAQLPLLYYAPDFLFCFAVAVYIQIIT